MNSEWNLKVLYDGLDDPRYAADLESWKTAQKELDALVFGDSTVDAAFVEKLLLAMEECAVLESRLFNFVSLSSSADTENGDLMAAMAKLSQIGAEGAAAQAASAKLLAMVEDPDAMAAESPVIREYTALIRDARRQATHLMSNEEEALASALDTNGASGWSKLQSYLTSTLEVEYRGETVTLSEIRNLAQSPDRDVRRDAYEAELRAYRKAEDAVAFALNNIKGQVTYLAERRNFASPLAEALEQSHMSRETLDAMLSAVQDYLPIFRKYLRKKGELLGYKNGLPWFELYAPLGENARRFTAEECRDYLLGVFGDISPDIAAVMRDAFENEWIDFYPRSGKEGGAFDCGIPEIKQSRILTNFDGSFDAVDTLAHELGHAFHDRQVENERPLNTGYPMPVAETASTFDEICLRAYATEHAASKEEELSLLEAEISGSCACVVDIYSRYLFETAVFEQSRDSFLMADDLCRIMLECQDASYGDGLDPEFRHPYMWLCKSHYYISGLSFYNFPYTFGELFAQGLYALYREDPAGFMVKYKEMLRTTPVHTMEENGAMMGVDLTKKEFWEKSLANIAKKIEKFLAI